MSNIINISLFLIISTLSLISLPIKNINNSLESNSSYLLKKNFKKESIKLLKGTPHKIFLKKFYKKNNYKSLWIESNEINRNKTNELFSQINNDLTLNPNGVIIKQSNLIEKRLDENMTTFQRLRNELKLTSLYYSYLKHTLYGEIEWKKFSYKLSALKRYKINANWIRTKAPYNISKLLTQNDINKTIEEITPNRFGYSGLLKALKKLTAIKKNGGWGKLPKSKKLKLGSSGDIVKQLRKRLTISGDYQTCDNNITFKNEENNESNTTHINKDALFDECLNIAVKKFQKRHGLAVDGVVGRGTKRALNMSVDEKIRKVLLNIDRIKWLPREELKRYIVVNIPEFMLHYIENSQNRQNLKVIVGQRTHPTPIFSQNISFIVLNPYWKVPEGIVRREIIPAMIKNPNYLRKQGLEAHRTWDENSRVIDTSFLYWEDYLSGGQKFPYRLMQPPGPRNALGKIKFKFPNRFSVYLHDTPTRYLFKKSIRAFSHGCVRLSQPEKLLKTISTFDKKVNFKKSKRILKGKHKRQLNMSKKLRIYLVYLTAGMNKNGELEFRDDIYHYDKYTKRHSN